MQLTNRYHRIMEKLLPVGTSRHHYYELVLTGIRIIFNEGWRSFFKRAHYRLIYRNAAIKESHNELPKFNAFISKKEMNKLAFPAPHKEPEVSIVIPVYNNWKYTFNCLRSIAEKTNGDYEIIVINDASTDKTAKILSNIKNLNLLNNKQNTGFIDSCNRGAKTSKGKYILFLNNDTMVAGNWLPPLLKLINREDVGAVGSRLVYPDATLQEAGSIVWHDGSALGYGRGDDADKPEYNYIREVDYCSGACLLVKKDLFEKIDGFDERFKPGYYEDTDLCFSIRNLGYKVMYQPTSTVVHFEGVTCGTDINAGIKKYQKINQPKFAEKWKTILKKKYDHYESCKNIISSRNRLSGKSILILDDRVPTPEQGTGYPRAYQLLKLVAELRYKATFFPLINTTPWQPYTNELQQLGIEVFYGKNLNLSQFAKDRENFYDLVLVSRPHNMKNSFNIIKKFFPKSTLLYDAEALFSMREMLKAKMRRNKKMERAAKIMMEDELDLIKKADLIITVSENEKKFIVEKTGLNNINIWGHPIAIKNPQASFCQRKDILFVGGFLTPETPNEDAILYFVKEIFPKIEKRLRCRLFVIGRNPPGSVKKLSSSSIIVIDYVENLREYYEKCRVFIVPHRFSAGIPWKLHEAMAYGVPSVVSKLIAAQLNLTNGKEVLIADTGENFAKRLIKLYQDEKLWYKIQHSALGLIEETCNPKIMKNSLNQIITRGLKCQGVNTNSKTKKFL